MNWMEVTRFTAAPKLRLEDRKTHLFYPSGFQLRTTGWEGLVCFRVHGPWSGRALPTCRFSAGRTETYPTVNSHLGRNQQCRWWLLASTISTPIQGLFPACSWSHLGISLVLLQDRESSLSPPSISYWKHNRTVTNPGNREGFSHPCHRPHCQVCCKPVAQDTVNALNLPVSSSANSLPEKFSPLASKGSGRVWKTVAKLILISQIILTLRPLLSWRTVFILKSNSQT